MVDEPKDQDIKEGPENPGTMTYDEVASAGNAPRSKRLLDADVVARMKKAGIPKPDDVPVSNWNQVQEVQPGPHTLVAHLRACGLQPKEIALQVGLSVGTVKQYLASEKIQFEIRRLQHRYFGQDPMRRFQTMLQEAADTLEETMRDKQVKPSVRVMAADKILDRALGKPKQHLTVEGSLIRKVYESLDSNTGKKIQTTIEVSGDNPNVRDVGQADAGTGNPNEVEKPVRENPNTEPATPDKSKYVDDWVEQFFK